jgi:hypothetical protein
MQTQVVHQRKVPIPWIPILVAALLVLGAVFAAQLALRDPETTVTTPIASVDLVSQQKAEMLEAGITGIGIAPHHGVLLDTNLSVAGPHPRVKFQAPDLGSLPRDPASEGGPRFRGHPLG